MANFIPSKKEAKDFNNGTQYVNGDALQSETINNLVESALYSQQTAEGAVSFVNTGIQEAKNIAEGAVTVANEAKEKVESAISNIALTAYPVGAYYISNNSTSPASLFGGSWTSITGRFLYANAGTSTGGSTSHTHTLSNNAAAKIRMYSGYIFAEAAGDTVEWKTSGSIYRSNNDNGGDSEFRGTLPDPKGAPLYGTTDATNLLPPYQTVYAWRRTA